MRMNYKTYPTDYVQELNYTRGKAGRKKSRAFMEYYNDMEHGEKNAIRFYANSWEVSSSTAKEWIDEFNYEIELFFSHWELRNKQHYNYAKNPTEHQPNTNRTQTHQIEPNITDFQKSSRTPTEHQPNKALNSYDDDIKRGWVKDKNFNDLFFMYASNAEHVGKKEDAYLAFINVHIDIDLLKLSAVKYLRDASITRKYNLANFLKNEMYIKYMPKRIKLTINGEVRTGVYDDKTMLFKSETDSFVGQISAKRLVELYEARELEFLKY